MFAPVDDPKGNWSFVPIPRKFFLEATPFGGGAVLILNKFLNNSGAVLTTHSPGIAVAIAQARANFGPGNGVLEVYGLTDRTGSDAYNLDLSAKRAKNALLFLKVGLGLSDFNLTWSAGLGERFAAEYYQEKDSTIDANFRGVACYLWDSFSTATDIALQLHIKFASPPGGAGAERSLLGPLHLGRFRSSPPSPFGGRSSS